ncbi:MAG TPA: flagellar hook assembly protein FlgD [Polyangiaceae bacterium]|nr:flagellar hook assembly protein FlgD [Polyangiaceae bacterium]
MSSPVDPTRSTTLADPEPLLTAQAGQALDREAFLKLLVAQLEYQDPLKPQDSKEFIAELAQFSSLEQAMGINDRLDLLAAQSRGLQNAEIVGMVGKQATVRGSLITSDGSGSPVTVAFTLDAPSATTRITLRDANGRVVRTFDLGEQAAGTVRVTWDGRDDSGLVQPAGTYAVSVAAEDADGAPVLVSQETTGRVESVSFDKGYPVLHLDNGTFVPVSDLLRVGL